MILRAANDLWGITTNILIPPVRANLTAVTLLCPVSIQVFSYILTRKMQLLVFFTAAMRCLRTVSVRAKHGRWAAAAMELRRLGLSHKPMFVVPNSLTEQWGTEFQQLYPGANILVASEADFTKENRKAFCARIATGDYDAIIIGHTQFEKIPLSPENERRHIETAA